MNRDQLYQWIRDPSLLNKESLAELGQLITDYPYFQTARLLNVLNLKILKDYRFEQELHRVAAFAADRSRLRDWVSYMDDTGNSGTRTPRKATSHSIFREAPADDHLKSIEEQIRASLEEIERKQSQLRELIEEKKALAGEVPSEEKALLFRPLPKDDLLEEFIRENQPQEQSRAHFFNPEESAKRSVEENDGILSETLARLVAAQGKKERAIKIYQQLMLKNPQKSSYFAAQIEKLRKET